MISRKNLSQEFKDGSTLKISSYSVIHYAKQMKEKNYTTIPVNAEIYFNKIQH